ncbi:hypothetical protein L228DRAFT_42116 [Xylona heveae TC161]|uniref:Uncharacterized protein n=1 Tax=Xylona heveae (strain CBS 132557 / TC161) TaxID=1328760 RepID=A0A164ZQ07_XYLHT|nr:hypothetical protein L228DRAFT_42116 [Xylona heveae TC161]KZF19360.1 hypothetical protein L228DRAFT_42116 [Xylona heveae TC161]
MSTHFAWEIYSFKQFIPFEKKKRKKRKKRKRKKERNGNGHGKRIKETPSLLSGDETIFDWHPASHRWSLKKSSNLKKKKKKSMLHAMLWVS